MRATQFVAAVRFASKPRARPPASLSKAHSISSALQARQFSGNAPRVAVLHQAIEPPIINGTRKPPKPGGYRDSGADIAFGLKKGKEVHVICPSTYPDPTRDSDWSFPDTEQGILEAINRGATHLWANNILFASHPLQASESIAKFQDDVKVVGQPPQLVEYYDDKDYVNNRLRAAGNLHLPRTWTLGPDTSLEELSSLPFPVVSKPARGRGSYGVKVSYDTSQLQSNLQKLRSESLQAIVEEYLAGEEATITVMPPNEEHSGYWSLPAVTRFNHENGIAPYNGTVAVTANSRVVTEAEMRNDPYYQQIMHESEEAARLLGTTAPIRVDVRRYKDSKDSQFALFDVNMKPNMTGPGRPGRDDQASLTLLAAEGLGWNYSELLRQILRTATDLRALRETGLE